MTGVKPRKKPDRYSLISEKAFTTTVIRMAQAFGWKVAHFRPGMTLRGRWVTPVQGDGAGFPDLFLLRADRLIIAELKTERGRLSERQVSWYMDLLAFSAHFGPEVLVTIWRPSDIDKIEAELR